MSLAKRTFFMTEEHEMDEAAMSLVTQVINAIYVARVLGVQALGGHKRFHRSIKGKLTGSTLKMTIHCLTHQKL